MSLLVWLKYRVYHNNVYKPLCTILWVLLFAHNQGGPWWPGGLVAWWPGGLSETVWSLVAGPLRDPNNSLNSWHGRRDKGSSGNSSEMSFPTCLCRTGPSTELMEGEGGRTQLEQVDKWYLQRIPHIKWNSKNFFLAKCLVKPLVIKPSWKFTHNLKIQLNKDCKFNHYAFLEFYPCPLFLPISWKANQNLEGKKNISVSANSIFQQGTMYFHRGFTKQGNTHFPKRLKKKITTPSPGWLFTIMFCRNTEFWLTNLKIESGFKIFSRHNPQVVGFFTAGGFEFPTTCRTRLFIQWYWSQT